LSTDVAIGAGTPPLPYAATLASFFKVDEQRGNMGAVELRGRWPAERVRVGAGSNARTFLGALGQTLTIRCRDWTAVNRPLSPTALGRSAGWAVADPSRAIRRMETSRDGDAGMSLAKATA
jgi:hypothetical protein